MSALAVSKALGMTVIAVSFTVKVPLIYSCWKHKTTKGLSAVSLYTEVLAIALNIVYSVIKEFPLTAWGELLSVLAQDFAIVLLIWRYSNTDIVECLGYTTAFALLVYLTSFHLPDEWLWMLPFACMLIGWSGVIPQIMTNFRNKHTGPLSLTTQALIAVGTYVRIFTTIQEVDDDFTLFAACVGSCFQTTLLLQILGYQENTAKFLASQHSKGKEKTAVTEKVERAEEENVTAEEEVDVDSDVNVKTQAPPEVKRELNEMLREFLKMAETSATEEEQDLWVPAVCKPTIMIEQRKGNPFCMRIRAVLDNKAAAAFSVIDDSKNRKNWDPNVDENFIVEKYDDLSAVVYSRGKAIWPLAARDFVLLSMSMELNEKYLNVVKSVVHPDCPETYKPGAVRAEADVMGTIVEDLPSGFKGFDGDGYIQTSAACIMTQIGNIDPKGNIPSWLISTVATKTIPYSVQRLNDAVKQALASTPWPPETSGEEAEEPEASKVVLEQQQRLDSLERKVESLSNRLKRLENVGYLSITALLIALVMRRSRN